MLGYKVIFDRGYINVEFDVRFSMLVLFDVTNVETFVVKFSTFVTSKFRHKSLSVIEAEPGMFQADLIDLVWFCKILKLRLL